MDHHLQKSVKNQCMKPKYSFKNLHWKDVVVQTTVSPCGRGSAIVCAKNAKTAATERAENFIINFLVNLISEMESLQMMFLSKLTVLIPRPRSETPLIGSISYAVIRLFRMFISCLASPWALITHDQARGTSIFIKKF